MAAHTALERRGRWVQRKFQAAKVTKVRLCLPRKDREREKARKKESHVAQTGLKLLALTH